MNRLDIFHRADKVLFIDKAEGETDKEVCALYDNLFTVIEDNYSSDSYSFTFKPSIWHGIEKENYLGILHSHLPTAQPNLSPQDIWIADKYNIDIACYSLLNREWDFYSPHMTNPYPLKCEDWTNPFKDLKYETYRSDCYRFIENCYRYLGHNLVRVPRIDRVYEIAIIKSLEDYAGWDKTKHNNLPGNLKLFSINCEYHFALTIDAQISLTFTNKGIRILGNNFIGKYLLHEYSLKSEVAQSLDFSRLIWLASC